MFTVRTDSIEDLENELKARYGDERVRRISSIVEVIADIMKQEIERNNKMATAKTNKPKTGIETAKAEPMDSDNTVFGLKKKPQEDPVNHPKWYGSKDDPYETIKVIEAWGLNFTLGNALKYISRAGKKDPSKTIEDLQKALFYIQYEIDRLEANIVSSAIKEGIGGTKRFKTE